VDSMDSVDTDLEGFSPPPAVISVSRRESLNRTGHDHSHSIQPTTQHTGLVARVTQLVGAVATGTKKAVSRTLRKLDGLK
jgi:hypothetical protein